ncbi:hypothetical protein E3P98_01486 [Wallemia ichthyophaga]|nr:hypothetical protein E3P98_01486 [Wallemia ichthyophaga]
MSSFKRRDEKHARRIRGTKVSPTSGLAHVSSGSAALDDVYTGSAGGRGGLGLSDHSLTLVVETDPHAAYADILLRYYLAQGIAAQHAVLSVGLAANSAMWLPLSEQGGKEQQQEQENDSDKEDTHTPKHTQGRGDSTIAWRYTHMKRFETSINTPSNSNGSDESSFLSTFDLTQTIPAHTLAHARERGLLEEVGVDVDDDVGGSGSEGEASCYTAILARIEAACKRHAGTQAQADANGHTHAPNMLRIVVRNVGSLWYGDSDGDGVLYRFFYKLRHLARTTPYTTIYTSAHMQNLQGVGGVLPQLLHVVDGCVALESFSDAPHRARAFAPSHGLLHCLARPAVHALTAPSDRHSVLRGGLVAGDNNLAFKLRRRRLVIETLHLDVEGGVGERRTTPSKSAAGVQDTSERVKRANEQEMEEQQEQLHEHEHLEHIHSSECTHDDGSVQIEGGAQAHTQNTHNTQNTQNTPKVTFPPSKAPSKGPRRVAFQSDKPELYEF